MEYLERVKIGTETEATGERIYNLRNRIPIFKGGYELKYYEIESLFRESKRVWIVRIETLDAHNQQLIVLKKKFDKPFKK